MTQHRVMRRRMRSRAAFEILKIIAVEIAAPILAAELGRLYFKSPPGTHVSLTKQNFYTMLHRLAERGFIRLEGARRKLTAILTKDGEIALASLEELADAAELTNVDIPAGTKLGVNRDDANEFPVAHKIDACVKRRDAAHKLSKKGGLFYVSYDLPKEFYVERKIMKDALRTLGFRMLHESFYVGTTSISPLILAAEKIGVLPFMSWGKMTPMAA